ncbi:histidine kinase [Cellulomonas cellasea]|uniref:sensor histidine kinase n=1 Tax=Cellulomonas cellasea TaxID=43670 RepID=UPI0025A392F1|nr:histidine kinase [Cellulomonas cellasea]MDM8083983.1 histidine kinase [Cellulomonas cellasea]
MPVTAPRPLRRWSRIWRYLVAAGVALVLWFAVAFDLLPRDDVVMPDEAVGALGAAMLLDLLFGVVSLALLPLRRRFPTAIAAVTGALSALSGAAVGAAILAAVSMGTRRRWGGAVGVGAVWLAAGAVYEGVYRPALPGGEASTAYALAASAVALAVYAACVATGFYIGARRELLATLQERAETAEREQALRAEAARDAERTRIAREMHDVLAHRISLVAMHAGALTYRTDLTPAETAGTAAIIEENAHSALIELRQVLGVLRAGAPDLVDDAEAEPPQPSLRELRALLAETVEAGTPVHLDIASLPGPPGGAPTDAGSDAGALALLPVTLSRTAFRIVQEALTNARKHAPGAAVALRLAREGTRLTVEVRNATTGQAPRGVPGAGLGLTGLEERASLAGGVLTHGVDDAGAFLVTASLPWEH